MTTESQQSLRSAILGFLLTLAVIIGLLTIQFLLHYGNDIFGNNIGVSTTFKMMILAILATVELALPISVLVMTTIYFRKAAKQGYSKIRIKPTLIASSIFSVTCFLWTAFAMPIIQLHEVSLLFDIRNKEINKPMEKTDLSLFKNAPLSSNYFELKEITDSMYNYTSNKKKEYITTIKEYQLTGEPLKRYQDIANHDLESNAVTISRYEMKSAQMISFPFLIFILFYSGMFIGILNKNNILWPLLLIIYLVILPGIHYLSAFFQSLTKEQVLSPFKSQLFYLSIILLVTLVLYLYARKQSNILKTE